MIEPVAGQHNQEIEERRGVYFIDGKFCIKPPKPESGMVSVKIILYDGSVAYLDFLNLLRPEGFYALQGLRSAKPQGNPGQNPGNDGVSDETIQGSK